MVLVVVRTLCFSLSYEHVHIVLYGISWRPHETRNQGYMMGTELGLTDHRGQVGPWRGGKPYHGWPSYMSYNLLWPTRWTPNYRGQLAPTPLSWTFQCSALYNPPTLACYPLHYLSNPFSSALCEFLVALLCKFSLHIVAEDHALFDPMLHKFGGR